jgi:hypothetical protein
MTRKHFIALADTLKSARITHLYFLNTLASFYESQNVNFDREHWLNYIAGHCNALRKRTKCKL